MKQWITMLLALALTLTLCACAGEGNGNTTAGSQETNGTQQTENTQAQPSTEATVPKSDEKTYQVPGYEIWFSYPSSYFVNTGTHTVVVREKDECLVAVYYDWQGAFENPSDMISAYSESFMWDISAFSKGYLRTSEIETTSVQNGSVAGYDCVIFNGKASNQGKWDCHLYGYALTIGEVNIMVIGLVSAKAQDAQMIADTDALTDQIAATLRTHK